MNNGERRTFGADVKLDESDDNRVSAEGAAPAVEEIPPAVEEVPAPAPTRVLRVPPPPMERKVGWSRLKRIPGADRITAVTVSRGDRSRVIPIPNFDVVDVPHDVARVALRTGAFVEDLSNFAKLKK